MPEFRGRARKARAERSAAVPEGHAVPDETSPAFPAWGMLQQSMGNQAVGRLLQARDRAAAEDITPVEPATQSRIEAQRGSGSHMAAGLKGEMEATLGVELPDVSLHTGPEADAMARGLGARAFTQGRDVFLRSDRDPSTADGRETLAHELTHVAGGATEAAGGAVQREGDQPWWKQASMGAPTAKPWTPPVATAPNLELPTTETAGPPDRHVENESMPPAPEPANPGMQAMWDAAVTANVNGAFDALNGDKPQPEVAYQKLRDANRTMKALGDSYRDQGNEPLADSIGVVHNRFASVRAGLEPHIGVERELSDLAEMISGGTDRLDAIRGQLK